MQNRIKQLREARGWDGRELAKKVHTSPSQISRLENGERRLTLPWITRLAKALDVLPDEIVELPFNKQFMAKCDPALLGSTIGWLLTACEKHKIKPDTKNLSKWASYVYNEAVEHRLNFKRVRELAFNVVKVARQKR